MLIHVILESFSFRAGGSEGGTGVQWARVLDLIPEIGTLDVLVSDQDSDLKSDDFTRAKFHVVPISNLLSKFRDAFFIPKRLQRIWRAIFTWLIYWVWLRECAALSKNLTKNSVRGIFFHCSFSTLMVTSGVRRILDGRFKVVLCGAIPVMPARGFRKYIARPSIFINYLIHRILFAANWSKKADFIFASNVATLKFMEKSFNSTNSILFLDPCDLGIKTLNRSAKNIRVVLFVDTVRFPRKGRLVLKEALARRANEFENNMKVIILTSQAEFWLGIANTLTQPFLPEDRFSKLLESSGFIVSASWREGTGTSIIRGMASGLVPILPNTDTFAAIPDDVALKYCCEQDAALSLGEALVAASRLPKVRYEKLSSDAEIWTKTKFSSHRMQEKIRIFLTSNC
jgi:hypothetical protein